MLQEQHYYTSRTTLPMWVPRDAWHYLAHTENGYSIRALARRDGCHASTILRQIRKMEQRRDDPLIDAALERLGREHFPASNRSDNLLPNNKETATMTQQNRSLDAPLNIKKFSGEARRILRRLCETGAVLAVAENMEKAVVVRDGVEGASTRTAVVDAAIAQAMALKDWISCTTSGRISRYQITPAGRSALSRLLAEHESQTRSDHDAGFAEAQTPFANQHRTWGEKNIRETENGSPRKIRYNLAESPLTALARRKTKEGDPFLSDDLVSAGERLREDFELAQMGPRITQNWDNFLTGSAAKFGASDGIATGPTDARDRVAGALTELGPGLSDVVLRCCCFLEGLEMAEKRMGWSARSGKIVLRIALQRLKRHYEITQGKLAPMIG